MAWLWSTPPTSWEEFRRLALALTQRDGTGNIIRGGAAIGTSNNIDFFSDIIGLMFAQAEVDTSTEAGLTSAAAKDALLFYITFVNDDHVWDNTLPEASTSFAQEKVSMIFVPSWNLMDIIRVRPDLDIGVAPVPQASIDNPVSWGSFWMYAVPEKSANKAAAWDFIKFLGSEEAQLLQYSTASTYRPYGAPYSISGLAGELTSGASAKYLKAYLDVAPYSKYSYLAARAGNTSSVAAMKDAVNSMITPEKDGRPTPVEALQGVWKKITGAK
jgi:ABC-type glycerol-3-phosphate transport system substrate-binding protein